MGASKGEFPLKIKIQNKECSFYCKAKVSLTDSNENGYFGGRFCR